MWALCLATLVLVASFATALLRETPDYIIAALVLCSFVAAAVGVFLNLRLETAHSEALRDPLTGLPNRTLLDDRIEQAFARSRRSGEPFTLIAIDLDGFKEVNDVRGHRAGDTVLKTLARRFEAVVREADTVARVGGDEFVVLSIGTGGDERATALVGRLRHALRRPFRVDGAAVEIDGSVGWAVYPDDGTTGEALLSVADGQMYATKRDTSEETVLLRRGVDAAVVRDVETALEKNELLVVYQPIIDLSTGTAHSAEALVRRVLPDGTLLPPAEFVPHVERTPLVRELTFLVIADALGAAEQWAKAGHELGV
ncbi:MAG TPA: diguanylate cyclase, partial [Gaiellaceae bacterium]|nr:diguanylate cyclase [Gaiellaceae bacterium]